MNVLVKILLTFFGLLASSNAISQYSEDEWAERDTWMKVAGIFEAASMQQGYEVADIGCHEGYLSVRLAKEVGEKGMVYAVDVRDDRLQTLKETAKNRGLENIQTILGDYDNPKLPSGKLDVVFIIDTYHEMEDYMTILKHVKRSLKSGGRVVIFEKLKSWVRGGTRSEQTKAHSLSIKYVRRELKRAGFAITKEVKDHGDWEKDSDKQMWFIVAQK